MKPIRVLVLIERMDRASVATMAMNYMRYTDRDKIKYDFLVNREAHSDYEEEIKELGGQVYHMSPIYVNKLRQYKKQFRYFLAEHGEYDIIHSHLEEKSYWALKIAKEMGVKIRICHGHNRPTYMNLMRPVRAYLKHRVRPYCTHGLACSEEVAKWLFGRRLGRQAFVLKYAIDTEKFRQDVIAGMQVREELNLGKGLVIGHIGRFAKYKNHKKLLDVFAEVRRRIPDAKLVIVGGGNSPHEVSYKEKIARRAREMQLSESIVFTGIRDDVERIIQCFDVFVMPSFHEGFPLALIEAQAAGIKCVVSDEIDLECNITGDVEFLPLALRSSMWSNTIIRIYNKQMEDKSGLVKEKGYDIRDSAGTLEQLYIRWVSDIADS
ncbi:MAG: glycosyltransferase [Lachnospiraceae bacterium]|nr:glycosyltransferase [Lachnospiraceae bacterium]